MRIRIVDADITTLEVDVVVNAANSSLLGGGGVDGAIHRKGGPEILAECRKLRAGHYGRGLKTGQAVATTAGKLPARWVVHTVGPVWSATEDRSELLADCHRNSLAAGTGPGREDRRLPRHLHRDLPLAPGVGRRDRADHRPPGRGRADRGSRLRPAR